MRWPVLAEPKVYRETIDTFGGYNHNLRIGDGEFWDMENMTSDSFPVLSPREGRGVYRQAENPQGLIAKDTLCYADGTKFMVGDYAIDLGLSTEAEDCPKQLVSMGAYVVIFPDKKYINTACLTDYGDLEKRFQTSGQVQFTPCNQDGSDSMPEFVQPETPVNPGNMALWMDTSSEPHVLKQWSASGAMWTVLPEAYIRISAAGIGKGFRQYDGVTLSGLKSAVFSRFDPSGQLAALEGSNIIWELGEDYLVVTGLLDRECSTQSTIRVERTLPEMDFVTESGNRLWGCRYGLSADGQLVNEIYASKLGDFRNWRCYMGLTTDSYTVSVGSDGCFTGAVTHMGYPLFFKENCLYRIYGSYPANFYVQTTPCRGVQQGSHRSLAIVGETLFYKSSQGVCAFDGSLPAEISQALGTEHYTKAVAAALGSKYYISMENAADGACCLFVYDAARGMWHRESGFPARDLCTCREVLYAIDGSSGKILMLKGGQEDNRDGKETVEWMAQTGMLCGRTPDARYLTTLNIRMALARQARIGFWIRYDSQGQWERAGNLMGSGQGSFTLPIRPRRCDHLHLMLRGTGPVRIYSITKTLEQGSDYF